MEEDVRQEQTAEGTKSDAKKILVVDDQAVNVEFLRKMITKWGYEVITAYRGIQALKEAQENHPDLILLDTNMPVMNGHDTLR